MIKDPFARLGLDREVLTVSQLNGRARVLLEDVFTNIWVEGEISTLARPAWPCVFHAQGQWRPGALRAVSQ